MMFLSCLGICFLGVIFVVILYHICLALVFPVLPSKYFPAPAKGLWAVVTGAGSGIGRGFSEELALRGYNLILLGRNDGTLSDCEDSIRKINSQIDIEKGVMDFSQPSEIYIEKVEQMIENKKISLLVNNVGMMNEIPGPFSLHDKKHITDMVKCNCSSPLTLSHLFIPHFEKQGKGGIIFLSSAVGEFASPYMAVYSGTKAFVARFAEALSEEVRPYNIDVLIMHPYYVSTRMSGYAKPSLLVCSTRRYASQAFPYLGRTLYSQPYIPHKCMDAFMTVLTTLVPLPLVLALYRKTIASFAEGKKNQ